MRYPTILLLLLSISSSGRGTHTHQLEKERLEIESQITINKLIIKGQAELQNVIDEYRMYRMAYDSIVCTQQFKEFTDGRKVSVSSQVLSLQVMGLPFFNELAERGVDLHENTHRSFRYSTDQTMKEIFKARKVSRLNMFFSEVVHRLMVVEIKSSLRKTNSYQYATQYGQGLTYLVTFDDECRIQSMKWQIVHYN